MNLFKVRQKELREFLSLFQISVANIRIDNGMLCGNGSCSYENRGISIGGMPCFSKYGIRGMLDDRDVIASLVAMCHEERHFNASRSPLTDRRIAISVISGMFNPEYYMNAWFELPCEIDAEAMGVGRAWTVARAVYPGDADALMLGYVNRRAEGSTYVIPPVDGGYTSEKQVEDAFEKAYEKSLVKFREPQGSFTRHEMDLVTNLLCEDHRFRRDMYYHFDKITDHMPGPEKDRMMASLVLSVHPEIQDLFTCLKGVDLSVVTVFGKPLPERSKDGPPDRELLDMPGPTGPVQPGFEKY